MDFAFSLATNRTGAHFPFRRVLSLSLSLRQSLWVVSSNEFSPNPAKRGFSMLTRWRHFFSCPVFMAACLIFTAPNLILPIGKCGMQNDEHVFPSLTFYSSADAGFQDEQRQKKNNHPLVRHTSAHPRSRCRHFRPCHASTEYSTSLAAVCDQWSDKRCLMQTS